jgi:hypothetical protein
VSLKVVIPEDKEKINRQIAALEYLISVDTNEKDRQIHQAAKLQLEKALYVQES